MVKTGAFDVRQPMGSQRAISDFFSQPAGSQQREDEQVEPYSFSMRSESVVNSAKGVDDDDEPDPELYQHTVLEVDDDSDDTRALLPRDQQPMEHTDRKAVTQRVYVRAPKKTARQVRSAPKKTASEAKKKAVGEAKKTATKKEAAKKATQDTVIEGDETGEATNENERMDTSEATKKATKQETTKEEPTKEETREEATKEEATREEATKEEATRDEATQGTQEGAKKVATSMATKKAAPSQATSDAKAEQESFQAMGSQQGEGQASGFDLESEEGKMFTKSEPACKKARTHANDDLDSRVRAILEGRADHYVKEAVGVPLVEGNLDKFQNWFGERFDMQAKQGAEDQESEMNFFEQREHSRLKDALAEGKVDPRSYLGVRYRKYLQEAASVEEKDAYSKANRQQQQSYRLNWAKTEFDRFEQGRTRSTSFSRTDTTRGVFMNFGRLVVHLGGWGSQEALSGALTAASQCLSMSGQWVRRHPQTKLLEFMILQSEFAEDFTKTWCTWQKSWECGTVAKGIEKENQEKGQKKDQEKEQAKEQEAKARKPKAKAKERKGQETEKGKETHKATGKETDKAKGKETDKAKGKETEKTNDPNAMWRAGERLKGDYQQAITAFHAIVDKIAYDKEWSWAAGRLTELRAAHAEVTSACSAWVQGFILGDMAWRKRQPAAQAMAELQAWTSQAASPISKLMGLATRLTRAHAQLHP